MLGICEGAGRPSGRPVSVSSTMAAASPSPTNASTQGAFAEDVFGRNAGDYGIAFAPDGTALYFTRAVPEAQTEATPPAT
jgi:hypothetical protein